MGFDSISMAVPSFLEAHAPGSAVVAGRIMAGLFTRRLPLTRHRKQEVATVQRVITVDLGTQASCN